MRSLKQHQTIMDLWNQGVNVCEIARQMGMPRPTAQSIVTRYKNQPVKAGYNVTESSALISELQDQQSALASDYSYLLGIYLGDGCISKVRNVFCMRIALDSRYPNIITQCQQVIQRLLPNNDVGLAPVENNGRICMYYVRCYYKDWPILVPQHDIGKKHNRVIGLNDWQQKIVDTHPLEFFRGLFHSDGSRFPNIVNGKDYPRYQFSNSSRDIIDLFISACKQLEIQFTEKTFQKPGQARRYDVFISKRKDVAYLDSVIGPKA
jgi:hypothetical protein